MIRDARTPVVVVTGFLGSGKTTLLNRLLSREKDSLAIVNEFGEVGVDHHLVDSAEERTVALPNGCLCCRLRGDLEETLVGAAMRRRRGDIAGFDRVIVETSGLADPGSVAQTLFADQALARDYRPGPVITVVDAADAEGRKSAAEVARAQIAAADVIVLSKTDRARDVDGVKSEIPELNPSVRCIPAIFGQIDPAVLLEATSGNDKAFLASATHAAGIHTFVLRFERPVPRALLDRFIATLVELRGADLLRVKGMVRLDSGELVLVQGVRHVFDRLRPVARGESALVFITRDLGSTEVEALWGALAGLARS